MIRDKNRARGVERAGSRPLAAICRAPFSVARTFIIEKNGGNKGGLGRRREGASCAHHRFLLSRYARRDIPSAYARIVCSRSTTWERLIDRSNNRNAQSRLPRKSSGERRKWENWTRETRDGWRAALSLLSRLRPTKRAASICAEETELRRRIDRLLFNDTRLRGPLVPPKLPARDHL